MAKKLYQILAPIILAGASLIGSGCESPYQRIESGNYNLQQKEFLDEMHHKYGEEVSYDEAKDYIRSRLDKTKSKIACHFLNDHVEKENCRENIPDKVLLIIDEAIDQFD